MDLKDRIILVTGGGGFIGSHLVDHLLDHDVKKVVVLDNLVRGCLENLEDALKDPRLHWMQGDILNHAILDIALKNVDCVFHLASICLAACQERPRKGFEVNVQGTFDLMEASVRAGVKRVIFASSSSIYGDAVRSPMDEEHPFLNKNFYGMSKICGEAMARSFYFEYGLPYVALRFMNIYGPRQDYQGKYVAVIMRTIDRVQAGLPPQIHGDGSQSFDFVYVEDACQALIAAMKSDVTDECYNISSGRQTSVLELCTLLNQLMDGPNQIDFVPYNETVLVRNRIGSTEKAMRDLGFLAQTSLEAGLQYTIAWKMNRTLDRAK